MKSKLSDKDFFESYCKSADIVFNNGSSEVAFIKDHDFKYCYTSPAYLSRLRPDGIITLDYIQGKNQISQDNEVQAKVLGDFIQQDKLVQSTLQTHNFIFVSAHNEISLLRKYPIINPETGNFVGIAGTARPFILPNTLDLIYKMSGLNFTDSAQIESLAYKLTSRQHMVLFLCIHRYSYTKVAEIISLLSSKISKNRVNNHIENLKYIFQVGSKEELIEKAIKLKYHCYVPRQLLKAGVFPVEDNITAL